MLCAKFGWNWSSASGEDFFNTSMYFRYFVIISPWNRAGPSFEQTWIPFTQGCFVPSLVERSKCEKFTTTTTTTMTTDNGQILMRKAVAQTRSTVKNQIRLIFNSNVNVVVGSWMYATHCPMVIDPCAKLHKPMSKQGEVTGWTWRIKKPGSLTLRSKIKVILESWMYATHCLMVINPHAIYSLLLSWAAHESTPWTNFYEG